MIKMSDIRSKTDAELTEIVKSARETVRAERFKDKFSRKAGVINDAKQEIARALTELSARRRNNDAK
ncbi:MAG: 50S ribosomal protein L29 [Candidatus Nomurabacteria bacterium]|nr:50S ribosomal protein L29 [Candidatus Nomurabacteria bacterium]USN87479.1 MAG: 50S ribosomal protein L29 [Candidatus Nomurabacteria bacterium]